MSFDRPLRATHHCRHYSYREAKTWGDPYGPTCAAGCDLSAPGATRQCWPRGENGEGQGCPKREEYADAERAAWESWCNARLDRARIIMPAIPGSSDHKKRERWGEDGTFPCPACKTGIVNWSRASNNGHVHAYCSTPNCFSMMQ